MIRRPPACEAGALPTELWPQEFQRVVGEERSPRVLSVPEEGLNPTDNLAEASPLRRTKGAVRRSVGALSDGLDNWWNRAGTIRRPRAYRARALSAELQFQFVAASKGIEPLRRLTPPIPLPTDALTTRATGQCKGSPPPREVACPRVPTRGDVILIIAVQVPTTQYVVQARGYDPRFSV